MKNFTLYLMVILFTLSLAQGQEKTKNTKADSTKKKIISLKKKTEKMDRFPGLFTFYQDTLNGSLYMEIHKNQINKEYIYFGHAHDGIVDVGFNRGSYRSSKIFSIQKYFNRIEFVAENYGFYFDPDSPLNRASGANISKSIMSSNKIIAEDSLKNRLLIQADDLFLSEKLLQIKNHTPPNSRRFSLGKLNKDKSKYIDLRNYPKNSEIVVQYSYDNPTPKNKGKTGITDARSVSLTIQHSLIKVPNNNYVPRIDDQRIGYFTTRVTDMTSSDHTPYRDLIHRWNLKKKDPGAKISEPEKPIIFWIENTTPYEFRDAVSEGVLAWNKSFEAAGFKNAIQVKVQPDNAGWDAGDIRYNVLRWTSSPSPPFGGYGPSFVNPKTGQILGADIMLEYVYFTNRVKYDKLFSPEAMDMDPYFCEIGNYLHQENLLGFISTEFLKEGEVVKKELIKESIIRLVLHEVGHTLGLNHNFKSSHLHNIEESHNAALTRAVGLTGSVMDYVPVNLSLNPKKQGQYYSTVPGTYDDWAILFGYSSPLENPKDEEKRRNNILALSTDPELMFGNDADDMRSSGKGIDPRVMIGDMTSEPIEYAVQRIKLMDKLTRGLYKKYTDKGVSFHAMRDAFNILTREKSSCASIISRFIGGVYVERFVVGQSETGVPLKPVPRSEQEKAMKTLKDFVFSPEAMFLPDSLVNFLQYQRRGFDFYGKTEDPKIHSLALYTHRVVLNHLLHPRVLQRTIDTQLYGNHYTIEELFGGLTGAVFSADLRGNVNSIRRNLQTEYVNRLINISGKGKNRPSKYDYISQAASFSNLKTIAKMMSKKSGKDKGTKQHREFLYYKIISALE
ncbi:uncharacterized protein METZ01_LOCUS83493 [marine metagenome]|uniref:EcxA zinc-binding domain-containing protein n=1 Tax=marine metagenome TaxID=408172 RepID=A0A381UR40_9ZZZZ